MGRSGALHGTAKTAPHVNGHTSRCSLPRACPLVRRPCTFHSPSHSHVHAFAPTASRRHAPDIKAWSGSSSSASSAVSTSGTPRLTAAAAKTPRLRVAVDVDEVLGRFVYALNRFCKDRYGMEFNVSDYWIYEFAKIWNCSQERSNEIVHEFFKSAHFREGIPVIPGAVEALTRLDQQYDLVVVTSRQHVIQDVTLDWLDRHYSGLFQEVYFGNHFAMEGKSRKKSEICRAIGARVLIDDNPSYAQECAAAGIHVLLYDWDGAYPWSKLPATGVQNDKLIRVVRDWSEVELALAALAPNLSNEDSRG